MFDKASLLECLQLHKSAASFYQKRSETAVNGTLAEAQRRLEQHERSIALLRQLLNELTAFNRLLPSVEEVIEYGSELGLCADECEDWFDWMATFGWRLKGELVMDWRAALRREKRGKIKRKQVVKKEASDPEFWKEFLKNREKPYTSYRFAPGNLKIGFTNWEKTRR